MTLEITFLNKCFTEIPRPKYLDNVHTGHNLYILVFANNH